MLLAGLGWFVALPACLAVQSSDTAGFPLHAISVEGNRRLAPEPIAAASGLKLGAVVRRADFDEAARRIMDTGFFESVQYRYKPVQAGGGSGYHLTFQVVEIRDLHPVVLDIPGVSAETLWRWLVSRDPLLQRHSPGDEPAVARYKKAVEDFLAEQ